MNTSVLFAFEAVFGPVFLNRSASTLASMPLDSACGAQCAGAIFAGAAMYRHAVMAYGEDSDAARATRNNTMAICEVYISG